MTKRMLSTTLACSLLAACAVDFGDDGDDLPAEATDTAAATSAKFPRFAGMNIGAKNYDDPTYQAKLAKLDLVVLGFYKGWKGDVAGSQIRKAVQAIATQHPGMMVGQYTVLNEAHDSDPANADLAAKLNAMNWWARNAAGQRVQWTTKYNAWDIDFTKWAAVDSAGKRYPEWLAERQQQVLFGPVPEFNIWYLDNVMKRPRVTADWNKDGVNDSTSSAVTTPAYRAGHVAEWNHIRKVHPGIVLMGNVDGDLSEPEFVNQLEGAFMEHNYDDANPIENHDWNGMMARYHALMKNTRAPHLVIVDIHVAATNYRAMRYALASVLLDDGYFSFTDKASVYSSYTDFDERRADLGAPLEGPQTAAWSNGVYLRRFQKGAALVNPTNAAVTVTLPAGYRRLKGTITPSINSGAAVTTLTLGARDGILLVRDAVSTLTPVADAYVRDGGFAAQRFGTASELAVKADAAGYRRKAYLRFDVASVASASQATLALTVLSTGTDASRKIDVYGVTNDSWSETTVTWDTAPAAGTYLGSVTIDATPNKVYQLDVTAFVKSNLGDDKASFVLVNSGANSSQNQVTFAAREAASGRPTLYVQP